MKRSRNPACRLDSNGAGNGLRDIQLIEILTDTGVRRVSPTEGSILSR